MNTRLLMICAAIALCCGATAWAGAVAPDGKAVCSQPGPPESVETTIWVFPQSGLVPFTASSGITVRNLLGIRRTMVGRLCFTLANGNCYRSLQPGVLKLGPYENYTFSWSQMIPFSKRSLGTNIFHISAQDVTPPPFNQPPYPRSGDKDQDTAFCIGLIE